MSHRTCRAPTVVALLLGILLVPLWAATAAWAHAGLIGTDPADGTLLPAAPAAVTLTFSEPVSPAGDATRLFDATGEQVPAEFSVVDTTATLAPRDTLTDGTYVVAWRVISADGHPISGGLTFSVGVRSSEVVTVPVQGTESDPVLTTVRIALEGLRYLGMLTLLGLVTFRLLVDTGGAARPVARRFRIAEAATGATAAVAAVLLVPVLRSWQDGPGTTGVGAALLDGSTWWSDNGLAAGLSVVAVLVLRRAGRWPLLAAAAVAAVAALALVGHTRSFGPAWLVVGADVLHVLTAATWVGGILALCLLLVRPPATADPMSTAIAVGRFSALAAWLVAGLAAAGLVLFFWIAGEFSALWTTAYGVLVLVKSALVLVVVAIAAVNRFRVVPAVRADPTTGLPRLRRTVTIEAVLLVVVVLVTGALVSQPPRPDPVAPAADPRTRQLELGDAAATLIIAPGVRGPNTVQLMLIDAAGRPAAPLEPPTISVSLPEQELGPFTSELYELGAGYWQTDVELVVPGTWTITVGARLSEFEAPSASTEISVE